jgi:hypothetical protein
MEACIMADTEEWVVWNGSLGILDTVRIGPIEHCAGGRTAFLAPPYGAVGPFDVEELLAQGQIAFGECLVMSRRRWQEDQTGLRLQARAKRRAFLAQFEIDDDELEDRKSLNLPAVGELQPAEINAAFRLLAKTAHPDAGGSSERYHIITEARDALLKRASGIAQQSARSPA